MLYNFYLIYSAEEQETIRHLLDKYLDLSLYLWQKENVSLENIIALLDIVDNFKDYHESDIRQLTRHQRDSICRLSAVYQLIEEGLLAKHSLLIIPSQYLQQLNEIKQDIIHLLFTPTELISLRELRHCFNKVAQHLKTTPEALSIEQLTAILFALRTKLDLQYCQAYAGAINQWLIDNVAIEQAVTNLHTVKQLSLDDTIAVDLSTDILNCLQPETNCRYFCEKNPLEINSLLTLALKDLQTINSLNRDIIIACVSLKIKLTDLAIYLQNHSVNLINGMCSNPQQIQQLIYGITGNETMINAENDQNLLQLN